MSLLNRRSFLGDAATGLSAIALASLLADAADGPIRPSILPESPLAPRPQHFPAKAKRALVLATHRSSRSNHDRRIRLQRHRERKRLPRRRSRWSEWTRSPVRRYARCWVGWNVCWPAASECLRIEAFWDKVDDVDTRPMEDAVLKWLKLI